MLKYVLILTGVGLIVLMGVTLVPITPRDEMIYKELKASSQRSDPEMHIESRHQRIGVSKQIWRRGESLQALVVNSKESELIVTQSTGKISMVEQLHDVCCIIQEELFYCLPSGEEIREMTAEGTPMQRIRYLEADEAIYSYTTQTFSATSVELWHASVEGHTPPSSYEKKDPLLYAKADTVEFTLAGEQIFLNGNVRVENEMGTALSDRAVIDCHGLGEGNKPTQITLSDHVQLINVGSAEKPAEQYALADRLLLFPKGQKMVLQGVENPVLFYDRLHDMTLSAPEVHAQRDVETEKERVQGIGDVRFVFGPEELQRMKERFKDDFRS